LKKYTFFHQGLEIEINSRVMMSPLVECNGYNEIWSGRPPEASGKVIFFIVLFWYRLCSSGHTGTILSACRPESSVLAGERVGTRSKIHRENRLVDTLVWLRIFDNLKLAFQRQKANVDVL